MSIPVELEVLALLRERVPRVRWDARQVVQCVCDFEDVDVLEVAARCAAYMQDTVSARNGPRTLRTFLERERADSNQRSRQSRDADRLRAYHRPRNEDQ